MGKTWLVSAAILAGLAVAFGAFGAHALERHLKARNADGGGSPERALNTWEIGARYQMYHALALFGLGLFVARDERKGDEAMRPARRGRLANIAGGCFLLGTVLFSGSLYALVLTKISMMGMITPIGGLFQIAGWIAFAGAAIMRRSE